MSIKITLSHLQLVTLLELVRPVAEAQPFTITERLIQPLVCAIYKRLLPRPIENKKKYKISWPQEQACAFYLVFKKHNHDLSSLEGVVLQSILNHIHQTYS